MRSGLVRFSLRAEPPVSIRVLMFTAILPVAVVQGNEPPVAPPPRAKMTVAPAPRRAVDVVALLRTPSNEASAIAARYETDRGALLRTYIDADSPARLDR